MHCVQIQELAAVGKIRTGQKEAPPGSVKSRTDRPHVSSHSTKLQHTCPWQDSQCGLSHTLLGVEVREPSSFVYNHFTPHTCAQALQ